jgi:hypothetical protein
MLVLWKAARLISSLNTCQSDGGPHCAVKSALTSASASAAASSTAVLSSSRQNACSSARLTSAWQLNSLPSRLPFLRRIGDVVTGLRGPRSCREAKRRGNRKRQKGLVRGVPCRPSTHLRPQDRDRLCMRRCVNKCHHKEFKQLFRSIPCRHQAVSPTFVPMHTLVKL